jgi:hypothetical protein
MKSAVRAGLVAAALFVAVPASSHHSFSPMFQERPVTLQGTLARIEWVNPHTYFYVDIKDETGRTRTYAFEGLPPGRLRQLGMTKNVWTSGVGRPVTVKALPSRSGEPLAYGLEITFGNGKTWNLQPR